MGHFFIISVFCFFIFILDFWFAVFPDLLLCHRTVKIQRAGFLIQRHAARGMCRQRCVQQFSAARQSRQSPAQHHQRHGSRCRLHSFFHHETSFSCTACRLRHHPKHQSPLDDCGQCRASEITPSTFYHIFNMLSRKILAISDRFSIVNRRLPQKPIMLHCRSAVPDISGYAPRAFRKSGAASAPLCHNSALHACRRGRYTKSGYRYPPQAAYNPPQAP